MHRRGKKRSVRRREKERKGLAEEERRGEKCQRTRLVRSRFF